MSACKLQRIQVSADSAERPFRAGSSGHIDLSLRSLDRLKAGCPTNRGGRPMLDFFVWKCLVLSRILPHMKIGQANYNQYANEGS